MINVVDFLPKIDKHRIKILIVLFFTTIILRAVFVTYTYSNYGTLNWSDDLGYIHAGKQYAEGNWAPLRSDNTYYGAAPIIPLLVAIFLILFNNAILSMFIYNIIVSSLMVLVLYYLAEHLFNWKIGLLIAIWGVFFIEAFKYSPHILKEPTLFLFLPLTLLLLVKSIKTGKPIKYLVFASLSFGWLIHTDERFFIYFPFFALFFFLDKTVNKKVVYQRVVLWIILGALLMLPWTIRNYNVFDQVVILSPRTTTFSSKLWGEDLGRGASHFTNPELQQAMIEARRERATEFGKKYGKTPYEYGKWEARIKAFQHFWQPTYVNLHFIQYGFRTEKWSFRHNAASMIFYGIFLPFYIIGFYFLVKRKHWLGFFVALIPVIHSLMHAYMVWSLERYRSPVTFIVVMVGIWAALEIYEWFRKRYLQKQKTV